ncbi:sensor histidine kinase [Streptomyces albidochromogenes]|uniref:histidine kinase n=1 Tax=Streptomyces albidochromogenes TaxID=329524 RepID=A0ABW6FPW9_9ACTN
MRHTKSRLLRPLKRSVTYTRWVHLWIAVVVIGLWMFIDTSRLYVPVVLVALAGLVPWVRQVEGVQARLLLLPNEAGDEDAVIVAAPSASWADRWRTVLWLEVRLVLGCSVALLTGQLPMTSVDLMALAAGGSVDESIFLGSLPSGHWWYTLLSPLPLVVLMAVVVGAGELITLVAKRLLGPSAAERLTALEKRTERLLERNRIARELHDSIGHALTVAVVQAGAARAANSAEFTDRALAAIEDTSRAALEDLERVLLVLRESGRSPGPGPTLDEADRLLESARASGAKVDADVSGPLERIAGPVSREGYRILQESLTNVLRHGGPVPVRVRIAVLAGRLELDVTSPLDAAGPPPGGGNGLRGIRERAALLGGEAHAGPHEGEWWVYVRLPLDGLR